MENKLTASELRIGNYLLIDGIAQKVEAFMPNENEVKFNKGDYFKISFEHHKHKLTYETASDEDVEPIPLTKEWLIKFGFEYEDLHDDSPYEWYKKNGIEIWDFNGEHWIVNCLDQMGIDQSHFKYVHQLQNIYFALTNEELTIK